VFSEKLSIEDDWTSPHVPGFAFDGEGNPRTKLKLLDKGVPGELPYDNASAKVAGVKSTGHAPLMGRFGGASPSNYIVAGGEKTLAEIIAQTDKAILVTRFWYWNTLNARQALNTGLTRDGLFLVENGKITKAIRYMRFTESIIKAFNNIEEVSSDRKRVVAMVGASVGVGSYVPGMKIKNFHFTGNTSL
jgi:predicted Zn-dependent protease